jgi:putative nucleotidyltransferase with HDIG domain
MVTRELASLADWPALDRNSQLLLIFSALFHDSGKPATTQVDPSTSRTHSPKHAIVGMKISRQVLRDLGCDLIIREHIANLVRYHGRPAHLLTKPDPAHELISLSWLINHRLLYYLALADTRGRQTMEFARPEDTLHLWKLLAVENNCFEQPYAFVNSHARFLFHRNALSSLHYVPHEDHRCTVTMMSGLPGAGKDTWLASYRPQLPVVSLDELRTVLDVAPSDNQGKIIQRARETCREHLRNRRDFAFNGTNTMRQTRKCWIDLFADYGARIELIYLEPPLPSIFERNGCRNTAVPLQVLKKLVEKLEPPNWTEAHELTILGSNV